MKKCLCVLFSVLLCISLCACDPLPYDVDRKTLNQVVSVDLIEYENTKQWEFISWLPNHFWQLDRFIPKNATVIETLPNEQLEEFLDTFAQSDILDTYYAYDSPKDVCLRFNYANGNFLIAWANYKEGSWMGYIGEYAPDGKVLSFWGCFYSLECYTNLIENYFSYTLDYPRTYH